MPILLILYEVSTKRLNEQVKRNIDRFPPEFAFQVASEELAILRSQSATSSSHGGRRYLPYVFTEHGVLMAANVLNSPRAVAVSVALVKAFVRLREVLATNQVVAKRLAEVEKTGNARRRSARYLSEDQTASPASARSAAQEDWLLKKF